MVNLMFEWDEPKSESNLTKHGLDFNLAIEIFSDPKAIMQFNRHQDNEDQYQMIGALHQENILISVIFTLIQKKIRVISARKASKHERLMYGQSKTN
jgi:uncharacterized DUF497 family protein